VKGDPSYLEECRNQEPLRGECSSLTSACAESPLAARQPHLPCLRLPSRWHRQQPSYWKGDPTTASPIQGTPTCSLRRAPTQISLPAAGENHIVTALCW